MMSSSVPELVVSYGDSGETTRVDIGVEPSVELSDEQVEDAISRLYSFLKTAFHLPRDNRLTLHETETGRTLSKETFRDPSYVSNFPRYWYLTASNGYTAATVPPVYQSLSMEDSTFQSTEYSDLSDLLIMEGYSPPDLNQIGFGEDDEEDLREMYPSLMELSMGQGSDEDSDGSREDLMGLTLVCNSDGDFGTVFRHFTVIASIPSSDHSSSEGDDSRSPSRSSAQSSDSTLNMSTLFVTSVTAGEAAEIAGVQHGDIVRSINGHSVNAYTTEEIIGIIEESPKELQLSVSPEKHDDLLFLYPQYIAEPPGEYDRGSNEKIVISDIVVRTRVMVSPPIIEDDESLTTETTSLDKLNLRLDKVQKRVRPSSADYNSYNKITTTIDSVNNIHSLDVTSPLEGGSSEQSLSSGIEYNSSIEDLLIRGSLADIPVQPSPIQSRKFKDMSNGSSITKNSSNGLLNRVNSSDDNRGSQNWYTEDSASHWYPREDEGEDHTHFTTSLPVHNGSSSNEIACEEFPSAFIDQPSLGSKKSKLALKLKKTFKNLTGTSTSAAAGPGHLKLAKTSSLGIVKTNSTSAIDRLRVNSMTASTLTARSRSTDLGKIRIKRSSLEALTKVSSEESVVKQRNTSLQKQNSCDDRQDNIELLPPLNIEESQLVPILDFVNASPSDLSLADKLSSTVVNSQGSGQYQLTPELGKNLSGDSLSSSQRGSRLGGRSYRSHRQRLHQTKNPRTPGTDSDRDSFTSSLVVTSSSPPISSINQTTPTSSHRRFPRDAPEGISPLLSKKPTARRTTSWQNRNSYNKLSNESSQDKIYNFSLDEDTESPSSRTYRNHQLTDERHQVVKSHVQVTRSRSANETETTGESNHSTNRHGFSTLVEPSNRPNRPHSSGGKNSTRKAMSVHPNPSTTSGSLSYDPRGYEDSFTRVQSDNKPSRSGSTQPDKFTSVFHGPIHKKQEKDTGGKKSSDRSWRACYAAIQKHRMVFYATVTDALSNKPLTSERPLDLHQCMVKVMPNGYKNRKNVFRLSSVLDGSECVIQSDSEESMMTWMRIIHNLNRIMRIRMGAPQMGMSQPHVPRYSTQEDPPKSQTEKKKLHRILTPQPPSKKKSHDHSKDDPSKRQLLLERLKRGKKKKEIVEDIDVPCYNTFGKPIEDCPASYENKSIPLLVMVCVKKLEKGWLDTEGLYRIAGPIGQVRTLANELNKGHFNLLQDHEDPHVVTAVLKKFLKELPDPLVPLDKYSDFISCAQLPDLLEKTTRMKELVNDLPIYHYHTLGFLMKHLTNIAAHHQVSKMNQHNLAIVFGPTVAHKAGGDVVVNEMNAAIAIIKLLMDNLDSFFSKVNFSEFYKDEMSNSRNRYPFLKGRSDPTSPPNDYYGARSQSPRKSWDGSSVNSLSRGNLTMCSQDMYLSNYDGNSQDLRNRGPHKRRLASSRGKLTNIQQEPDKELVSPKSVSAVNLYHSSPPPVTPSSSSSTSASPNRKISYVHAVNSPSSSSVLESLDSVNEESSTSNSRTEFPFTNHGYHQRKPQQDRKFSAYTTAPASQRTPRGGYSDVHHRRWSTVDPTPTDRTMSSTGSGSNIEIFGPTSTNAEWYHRSNNSNNKRFDRQQAALVKGPESRL